MMLAEEVDELLAVAKKEVAQQTFESSNNQRLQLMIECLGDARGMVRLGFAETLSQIGQPAIPFLIEALLNHPDPVVRRASAKTLTLIAEPETVGPLVHALLNDEDTVVKGSAVGALAQIGEPSVPVLLEILAEPGHPESTKGHAAWALAFIGMEAKEYLHREIASDSESVRAAVVGAFAKIAQDSEQGEAFEVLVNALSDVSETVRSEAAAALGNLGDKQAVPSLVQLLLHSEGETRKAAALSLMKIRDASALQSLQNALEKEAEAGVKQVIQLAITQLEKQTKDDDWG
jgi:bilin biosynthesis protein